MGSRGFGTAPDGGEARVWHLANGRTGMEAEVTDLGACVVALRVPAASGELVDVVLGYDDAAGYAANEPFFGAIIGRNANRTAGATLELAGRTVRLAANEGPHNNHSGPDLWRTRRWGLVSAGEARVELGLTSPDGDQGFPGELAVRVAYELTDAGALTVTYEADPAATTIVNLTSHGYFNLNGHASGTVLGHTLAVAADEYVECGRDLVPTGRLVPVEGTPLDLREPRALADVLAAGDPSVACARGLDHCFCVCGYEPGAPGERGLEHLAATLVGDRTGIALDVLTDAPGLQVYTANYVGGERGKGGHVYRDHDAVALEAQFWPDATHHAGFPQPVWCPGRPYRSRTTYAFRAAERP